MISKADFKNRITKALNINDDLDIKSIFAGNLGQLVYSTKHFIEIVDSSEQPENPIDYDVHEYLREIESSKGVKTDEVLGEILEALKSSPHVFGFPKDAELKIGSSINQCGNISINLKNRLKFSMKVPCDKRAFNLNPDDIEEFDVIFMGSSYICFTEVNDIYDNYSMAYEFREQMRKQLKTLNKSFRLGNIGPSPITPNIYLLDVGSKNKEDLVESRIETFKGDIILITDLHSKGLTPIDVFIDFHSRVNREVKRFFWLKNLQQHMFYIHQGSLEKLESIVDSYINESWKNKIKIYFSTTSFRREILLLQKNALKYKTLAFLVNQNKGLILEDVRNNKMLMHFESFLKRAMDKNEEIDESFYKMIETIENSISTNSNVLWMLVAAIAGGLISRIF